MSEALRDGYFDNEATTWSHRYVVNRHFKLRLAIALRFMPPTLQRLNLVDFGCGSGVMMRKLLEQGHSVTGIDASNQMIEEARSNVSADSSFQGRFNLIRANECQLPEADQPRDGIFCLGVLEYVEDPFALLKQFSEALRPDGFLVMSYPNKRSFLRLVERAVHRNPRVFRALGIFPHLTAKNSYMQHQRHQFAPKDLDVVMEPFGLKLYAQAFHVAPSWLGALAASQLVGMTAISAYRKIPDAR